MFSPSSSSPMAPWLLAFLLLLTSEVHAQGRLKLTVLSEDRLQMKWREADGPVQGYKVRVRPIADVPQPELMLTTTRGRATVAGLDPVQEYSLQVLVLNGTAERLLAKRRFTSGSPRGPVDCEAGVPAEVVLVVDGSWSIGRTDFRRVREFLEGVASRFRIGANHVRFEMQDPWPTVFCIPTSSHNTELALRQGNEIHNYTPKLLFNLKGGAVGQRIKNVLMELIQDPCASVVKKREVILRCLIEYMGESGNELIPNYQEDSRIDVSNHILKILVVHGADEDPVDDSILVKGHEILPGCNSTAKACSLLMGLIYALDLAYPPTLRYTFEVFQKLLLELNGFKLTPKVNTLELKLLS